MAEENRAKFAEATLTENAILEDMKEKSSLIDLPEESLAGSKRTESWVNKTTGEFQSAHKANRHRVLLVLNRSALTQLTNLSNRRYLSRLVNWMKIIPISETLFNPDLKKL